MNGVEVRIVQLSNRDTELGTESPASENSGAVELWRDGERILELVWWEKPHTNFESLKEELELYSHLTYEASIHHGTQMVRRPS